MAKPRSKMHGMIFVLEKEQNVANLNNPGFKPGYIYLVQRRQSTQGLIKRGKDVEL